MKLLIIIVKGGNRLEDLLTGFLEIGISGASVLDARGMGQVISSDVPIFAGLKTLFPGAEGQSQVILSVVSPEKAQEAMTVVHEIYGSLDEPGSGIAFTVPVEDLSGLKPAL